MIEPYMALGLSPSMRGVRQRGEIKGNIEHIGELIAASVWLSQIELPVKLIAIPEGSLQGFTDEVFDWDHVKYVQDTAIDIPGEETDLLGAFAKQYNTYLIAQAKAKEPDFPDRFTNNAFVINPKGRVIMRHRKNNVFPKEHSTCPHDLWDKWIELYGRDLKSFYPVADTEIGRIGCLICNEGVHPENARGLAMNGAEIIYRPSYPEPYVGNDVWEIQNRARALDNNCYVIAPNTGTYYLTQDSKTPIDVFGGKSMVIDYEGRVISRHDYGSGSSWCGAVIDIEALRYFRTHSDWMSWMKDMRNELFQLIYEKPIYPKNLWIDRPPMKHKEYREQVVQPQIETLVKAGIYRPSAKSKEPEKVVAETRIEAPPTSI